VASGETPPPDEWRLGIEPGEHGAHPALAAARRAEAAQAAGIDRSAGRLDRPLYTLTAEHLGWIVVALYALATRLIALGARPLGPGEARPALAALALARGGLDALRAAQHLSWIDIGQAAIFASLGASDATARLATALSGLLLIAAVFALRPYLGRAGALAAAALLAVSPSVAYFSRANLDAIPAAAFALVALALLLAIARRPTFLRAVGFGCAAGLGLAAGPAGLALAATAAVALASVGAWNALAGADTWLRTRVWWTRRGRLAIVAIVVTLAVWWMLASAFFARPARGAIADDALALFAGAWPWRAGAGAAFYLPQLGFYEFAIVLAALAGLVAILARRVRSYFAAWTALWMLASTAAFLLLPARRPEWLAAMLLPLALCGGFAIEWLHHTAAWTRVRYAALVFALLALYVQALNNFVYAAPDASEAAWARHALLYWSEPATTVETPRECAHAVAAVASAGASAAVPDGLPAIRWYLRDFAPTDDVERANLVASRPVPEATLPSATGDTIQFGAQESWTPDLHALTGGAAIRYFFTARAWSDVTIGDVVLRVRAPSAAAAPTVIVPPPASPVPEAAPWPASSAQPSPGTAPTPPAPSPAPTPSATASPLPTPVARAPQ
jgi:uncharacterized protein (TIGR03663 family)